MSKNLLFSGLNWAHIRYSIQLRGGYKMKRREARRGVFRGFSAWLLLMLIGSLLLVACGEEPTATRAPQPSPTAIKTTAPAAAPVTIRWSFWGDASEIEVKNRLRKQFEADHPNIRIEMVHDSWNKYFNRLRTEWVGDKTPDVMFLDNIPTWASQGYLENIEPFITRDKYDTTDYYKGLINMFRYNGTLHGLPRDNDTKVIYVNKDLLAAAGIPIPKAGWTWQDLRTAAQKLTQRDASGKVTQYGFAFEPDWWRLWVWQNGGQLYDNFTPPMPPTRSLLNSPEAIEAVQFIADLINVDKVTPTYEEMNTGDKISALFNDKKVAMAFGNHAHVAVYGQNRDLKWDIVPLPAGKKRANVLGGAGYTIHKNSQHKEAAWTFLQWLVGPIGQALFADTGVMVPSLKSVRENNIFIRQQPYNAQVFVDETELGTPYPEFLLSNKVDSIMSEQLRPVWLGQAKPAEVLAKLPAMVEPVFAEGRK
jgi:multiple sugar transport system substrate-binding protein